MGPSTVYLAYNTQSHLREMEESHAPTEAKWNLALWPHGAWIGLEDKHAPDDEGTRLVDAWLRMRADEGYTDADTLIPLFAALCVRIAQRLHRDGIITGTFGHAIPIIMHDDEWDEDIRTNNCAANLPGVAREFLDLEVI